MEPRFCTLADLRVARQIWLYAEVSADGTPNKNTTDMIDAEDAFAEGYYDEFYECRNCEQEWNDDSGDPAEPAMAHLKPAAQAELWPEVKNG